MADLAVPPTYYEVVTRLRDASGACLTYRAERLPATPYAMAARIAAVEAMYAGRDLRPNTVTVTVEQRIDWDQIPADVQDQLCGG